MNSINFLPASYLDRQARRQRVVRRVGAVVAALLLVGAWWMAQHQQTTSMRRRLQNFEHQLATARQQQTEVIRLREQYKALVNQVRVQRELAQSVSHTQILAMLGRRMPASVAITEINMITKRPPPRKAEDASKKGPVVYSAQPDAKKFRDRIKIEFSGFAPDDLTVANLVAALNACPLFAHVHMHSSRAVERFGYEGRKFKLTLSVPLNREFRPPSPKDQEMAHVRQ